MVFGTKKLIVGLSFIVSFLCGYGAEEIQRGYQGIFEPSPKETSTPAPKDDKPNAGTPAASQISPGASESAPVTLPAPIAPSAPPVPALGGERRNEYDSLFRVPESSSSEPPPENPYEQLNALVPSTPPPLEGVPSGFAPPQVVAQEEEVGDEVGDEGGYEEEVVDDGSEDGEVDSEEGDEGALDEEEEVAADEESEENIE